MGIVSTLFNGPDIPKTPAMPIPPPAAHPAVLGSVQTQLAGDAAKTGGVAAEGKGFNDTIKTSPQGLEAPKTAKSTLLG